MKALQLDNLTAQWGYKLWTLTFDLPNQKVNTLGEVVMGEFQDIIKELEQHKDEIDVLVFRSGKKGNFIAGADIKLFQKATSEKEATELSAMGQAILNQFEDFPFAKVAAINGTALGGGCETSLACDAIVMSNAKGAKIGLPEVLLGVVPGMGGCVRLPQKVGIATALDMILTGKQLDGKRAQKAGLADACLPQEDFDQSVYRWAQKNLKALKAKKRLARDPKLGGAGGAVGSMLEGTPMGRALIFKKAREGVMKKTHGLYPAPLEAISVIQSTGTGFGKKFRGKSRDKAMAREAQGFGKCANTSVSKNLIRLFFLTEDIKKATGLPPGADAKPLGVQSGAVLGAGVMGGGIAQLFAARGIPSRMKDLNHQALETGIQAAAGIFKKKVKRRRMSKREFMQRMNLIAPVLDYAGFSSSDVVVEAVIEKMDIKKSVLKELEGQVRDNCVIATNTSSLSVTEMQSVMSKPERFAGMHFFNPVHRMPLVEVIRGAQTSDETVATIFDLSKKLGKTPIVVKDAAGFLVNRLLGPYLNESAYLVADGVDIKEIDKAMLKFGMPMGPMTLIDEVGVDVGAKVSIILHEAFGARVQPCPIMQKVVDANRLGKKNGVGIYKYEKEKGRQKQVFDPSIYEVLGITPSSGSVTSEEIVDRCVLPMINEASRCLEEQIVMSASDVDLGMIMGTGFPPFRGGLLRYADSLGAKTIVEKLRKYEKRFGERFVPAPALVARAEHDQRFYPEG